MGMIAISSWTIFTMDLREFAVLASLLVAACTPPPPLIYEPSNWKIDESDDGAWITNCAGAEVRTYRKIVEDPESRTLRLELELMNRSGTAIGVEESSELAVGDLHYNGSVSRLFSSDDNTIVDGGYGEFAAVFDIEASVGDALSERIEITFRLSRGEDNMMPCRLLMQRVQIAVGSPTG